MVFDQAHLCKHLRLIQHQLLSINVPKIVFKDRVVEARYQTTLRLPGPNYSGNASANKIVQGQTAPIRSSLTLDYLFAHVNK